MFLLPGQAGLGAFGVEQGGAQIGVAGGGGVMGVAVFGVFHGGLAHEGGGVEVGLADAEGNDVVIGGSLFEHAADDAEAQRRDVGTEFRVHDRYRLRKRKASR